MKKGQTNSGSFKKGMVSWSKGKKLSKKHVKNLSKSHKNYKMPKEQKNKISKSLIGNKRCVGRKPWNKDTKGIMPPAWNKGNKTMHKKICLKCNNDFETRVKKQKYCSIRCANYIDGRSHLVSPGRYGKNWTKIRLKVLERDLFKCKKCGKNHHERRLDIHHIIPFLISFDNSLNNLVTLCRNCHRTEEEILKRFYYGVDKNG